MSKIAYYKDCLGKVMEVYYTFEKDFTEADKEKIQKASRIGFEPTYVDSSELNEEQKPLFRYIISLMEREKRLTNMLEIYKNFTQGTLQLAYDLELVRD